jgi:hypothetical protein
VVTLKNCIREVAGSNTGMVTRYFDRIFVKCLSLQRLSALALEIGHDRVVTMNYICL